MPAQPCLTLGNPMDCGSPGSSVHGILQARILEWVAMPSSRVKNTLEGTNRRIMEVRYKIEW